MTRNASQLRVLVLTNMSPSPRYPGWGAFVATQIESLRIVGVQVKAITRSVPSHWTYAPFYAAALHAVSSTGYEVVHAHYGFHSALPAMLARARPLVVTFHRGDALDEPQRNAIYRAFQRSCVKSASVLIAVSEEIRQALIERLSADPAKIRIVPCGIDPAIFRPGIPDDLPDGFPSSRPVVLWSGSDASAERKGFPIALAIARHLPEVSFVFLGISAPQSASPNCRFPGRVPNELLPRWLNAASLFFLPSSSEGVPVSLLEAMATGIPVLASPVGGIPALVIDGETGFHLSSPEINVAINQILRIVDPSFEARRTVTAAARELVISKYSLTAVANQLRNIYSELAA